MASDSEKRKLTELRVVDLRSELEKRDLDKNGVKAVLIERLEKILREEGHDPEEYLFDSSEKKTPIKRITKRGEQDTDENHDQSDMDEDIKDESFTDGDTKEDVKVEIDPKKEPEETLKSSEGEQKKAEPIDSEMSVKTPMTNTEDEVHVKKESEKSKAVSENTVTAESEKNDGKQTKESEKTDLDEIKSTGKTDSEPSKNSSKSTEKMDGVKPTTDQLIDTTNSNNEVDKQKLDIQSNKDADKDAPEANGVDNEDSINLTIGEDDEKLLAEEEESSQEKDSKDEGGVHKKERAGLGQDKQSTTVGEDKVKSQEEEGKTSADKSKSGAAGTNDQKGLKDEKDKKKGGAPPAGSSRNLWVSGLSSSTRATDLKQVFSKYGKVIGAKVVTNARTPGARCYGYVTMATSEDASKCIQYLHRTELHGRMISVERAKGDSTGPPRKSESKVPAKKVEEKKRHERKLSTTSGKGEDKKKEETEEKEEKSETTEDVVIVDEVELKKETEEDEAGEEKTGEDADKTEGNKTSPGEKLPTTRSREVSRDRKERERQRSVGSSHVSRPHSKSPHRIVKVAPRPGVLTFAQIRPQKRLRRRRGGRGRAKRAADFRAAKSISTVQENLVTGQDHPVVPSLHTNLDTDPPQPLSPSLQPNIYEASPAPPSLLANINEAPPVHYSLQANINTSLVSQFAQSFKPFTALPKLSGIMLPHTLQSNLLFQLLINDHLQTSMVTQLKLSAGEERERQRVREREREMREEERRRREEISRQRDLERRNREEAMKLEREKEKLRLERERIERDRAELIRLERERQRLEREKLEREREELKRQQLRLEEARRTAKRPAEDRRETYPDDRKRVAGERRFEGSSRFEERSNIFETKKDLKRPTDFNHRGGKYDNAIFDTTHSSRRDRDNLVGRHADVPRREHAAPDPPRGKDLFSRGKERFERPPSFRSRDDHRNESDHRSKLDVRHSRDRYPDSGKARVPGESRYTDRSGDTWHAGGGPVPAKTFGGGVPPRDSWAPGDRKPDVGQNWGRPIDVGGSDRWISGAGPLGVASRGPGMGGPGMYPGPGGVAPNIPGIAMGMSGGPYSGDRFDAYKQSMGPLRKY